MNRDELGKILEHHQLWRESDGREGARANLEGASLAGAYLADANLARANLARANLARANLEDANLARANLARANLEDANLARANLADANLARANLARANLEGANLARARGCILLTETDHGYRVVAGWVGGEWRIWAGCRDFTIAQAREHWGAADYRLPQSGSRIVALLDWLEKQPTPVEVAR